MNGTKMTGKFLHGEELCMHGVGHGGVHGCDGCCNPAPVEAGDYEADRKQAKAYTHNMHKSRPNKGAASKPIIPEIEADKELRQQIKDALWGGIDPDGSTDTDRILALVDKAKFAGKAEAYDDIGSMGAKHTSTIKIYAKDMADRYSRLAENGAKND